MINVRFACCFLLSCLLFGCSEQTVYTSSAKVTQHYSKKVIKAADISIDGELTLWSDNQQVCLWHNINNVELFCLNGLEAQLIEILGISKSKRFFYTSNRINVHLYDLASKRLITVWSAGDNIINDIAMSDNESAIIFGFRSGQASVVSIEHNTINTFKPHRLDINSVAISADGMKAFTGSSDKFATLWNTKTGDAEISFAHQSRVNHVNLNKNGNIGYSLDAIRDRFFWLTNNTTPISALDTPIKFIEFNDSQFSQNGNWLLSGSPKQKLALWRVKDGALLAQWQAFKSDKRARSSILSVEFISNKLAASFTSDGVYQTWPIHLIESEQH